MHLQEALKCVSDYRAPSDFSRFREHIDPAWIEAALWATGTASIRRRRLPAEQAIWLVLGMALLRRESIERVVAMLGLALPTATGHAPAKSSLAQARQRLGDEPLAYLFAVTADRWARESAKRHRWRGLSLHGLDGTKLRVPDSLENWAVSGNLWNHTLGNRGVKVESGVAGTSCPTWAARSQAYNGINAWRMLQPSHHQDHQRTRARVESVRTVADSLTSR